VLNRLHLTICLFVISTVSAREIKLRVIDVQGKAILYADVKWEGAAIGASSDEAGWVRVKDAPNHSGNIRVSSLGFRPLILQVERGEQDLDLGEQILYEDLLGLNEVVISATMRETFVTASPIKVEVINAKVIQRNLPATNLMDGLALVNGVQEVVACGVCNTNSISINGLPGVYTAVLVDGMPMYGSLASVYGLNGIPIQMVKRMEVIKGPSSTLYGSEAIGGVINIITKDPQYEPLWSADAMITSHAEAFSNAALALKHASWSGMAGWNAAHMAKYEDQNGDGFGDMIGMNRVSIFAKMVKTDAQREVFSAAAKVYAEDRWNGVEPFFTTDDRGALEGSDSVYGESISTRRAEAFGAWQPAAVRGWRLDYSLSWHLQDSYYGHTHYEAQQAIFFTNLTRSFDWQTHDIIVGISQRLQYYDDNTIATEQSGGEQLQAQYVPGIFVEDEWQWHPRAMALFGVRLDHYALHGVIPSPRASVKFNFSEWTTLRLTSGSGFKMVNLFTEDHAFVTGQRRVEIAEALRPERSWNLSTNLNHIHAIGESSGALDADVYYTRFGNKVIADYQSPGKIIYANSAGHAESIGMAGSFSQQFKRFFSYQLSANLNRTQLRDEHGAASPMLFAPKWGALWMANYQWRKWQVDVSYSASVTGPMSLPEVFDLDAYGTPMPLARPTQSNAFAIHNLQVSKQFFNGLWVVYGGIQNLLNYKQKETPLVGYNDPTALPGFSPYFDTSYSYAPMHGREWFIGLRLNSRR
jgi:outer membrane receptor for ferrienterochelin and colicins